LTVIAGTESGKPAARAAQRAMSPMPVVRWIHAARNDGLDAIERDPDPLAGGDHRSAEQVVDADVGQ